MNLQQRTAAKTHKELIVKSIETTHESQGPIKRKSTKKHPYNRSERGE